SKMMKPGIGTYDAFKEMFDRFSAEAGKKQYLIPYFIAAHPGTTDEDMLNLALWLKKNNFKLDQVQTFMPTPMAMATTMYHSRKNPLKKVTEDSEVVETARSGKIRKAHKAFLRYQDPANWPILRETLTKMGRADLIGNGERHLVPAWHPSEETGTDTAGRKQKAFGPVVTADKYQSAPRGKRAPAAAAASAPFIAPEGTVRPSILSTIKTKPKPKPAVKGKVR
ncbi:MAG: DUF3362 domain-containing protein, partial [Gammaproteobacteria bacterium]